MSLTTDAEIERITARFTDRTLPKRDWTHRAHFAVALYLVAKRELDVRAILPDMIRTYNEATGVANTDTDGYHETITLASLRAAETALHAAPAGTSLAVVLDALIDGRFGRSDWLLEHWSRDHLFSVEARRSWVEPDLSALPF